MTREAQMLKNVVKIYLVIAGVLVVYFAAYFFCKDHKVCLDRISRLSVRNAGLEKENTRLKDVYHSD